ncbi:MAG: DUF4416 family protein [Planctomycetota bacterium]
MADTKNVEPVIRFCAIIGRDPLHRRVVRERLTERWGDPVEVAESLPFVAGGYYNEAMGTGLEKDLIGFRGVADPSDLADWKHETNRMEREFASDLASDVTRPVNLDPGYVTQAKLVLATTKDRDHRIYLRKGMFAEITLNYVGKKWVWHRWTYPDYRTEKVAAFATQCRIRLRKHLAADGKQRRA